MKRAFIFLLILGSTTGAAGYWWYVLADSNGKHQFRTVPVERGTVIARISATGTIEPLELVDVGAQVAGQIRSFGKDLRDSTRSIDYCSPVEEGTVLAYIDDTLFKSRVANAEADLKLAEADVLFSDAKHRQAERDWHRARDLGPRGAVSGLDYDTARANYETCVATASKAKASLSKAQAMLEEAQTNLGYTVIRSPVKGVIVDRRVNIGQTVVASLNAPSLFLIAKDLKQMEIWAQVNEADIGQIFSGQVVRFGVDTYPEEEFRGQVTQIRLNGTMQNNVVTYTVTVGAANPNGKLLPYMTANLQFEGSHKENVLVIPNAALRWRPQAEQVAVPFREEFTQSLKRRVGQPEKGKGDKDSGHLATVWVEDDGFVRPVQVRIGLTDGVVTEIVQVVKGQLEENTEVVTGLQSNGISKASNPLLPRLPRP